MIIKNIVIGGGGMMSYALLGALDVLHEAGDLDDVEGFAGASAGAFISVVLALGLTPRQICDIVQTGSNMPQLIQINDPSCILKTGCVLQSQPLRDLLNKVLDKFPNVKTLEDIRLLYGKNVTIVATDFITGKPMYFTCDNTVNINVIDLLICSASLPMIFEPTEITYNDGTKKKYWDGMVSDPLPVQLFPRVLFLV